MNHERFLSFTVTVNDAGKRTDKIARKLLPDSGLGSIYAALRKGNIRINGKKVKPSHPVRTGDIVEIEKTYRPKLPGPLADEAARNPSTALGPNDITEYILFENEHVLAINKPSGYTVHGPNSLEQVVRGYFAASVEPSLSFRPGPLHRLDKSTTGVLLFGKSLTGARTFSRLLRDGRVVKTYIGVVEGTVYTQLHWDEQILFREKDEKKRAVTDVLPLQEKGNSTLCRFIITTGRHHQIRRQSSLHGHPLLGDTRYGGSTCKGGYILHALRISVEEQIDPLGFHSLAAPLPESIKTRLKDLFDTDIIDSLSSL